MFPRTCCRVFYFALGWTATCFVSTLLGGTSAAAQPVSTIRAAAVAANTSADWPAFRGRDGSGHSDATGVPVQWSESENVVWRAELPGPGGSTPIVVNQRVFITCYSGYNVPGQDAGDQSSLRLHLVCLDFNRGDVLWSREVEPQLPEQVTIREEHGYATNTPAADNQRVYAFFGRSGVIAYSHEGEELWRAAVGSTLSDWGSAASLLVDGNRLYVNASVESQKLYALDTATGRELWVVDDVRESWNTPVLARAGNRDELLVAIFGHVLGIDPASGRELWRCDTDIPWYMAPSMVVDDEIAYVLGGRPGYSLAVRLGGSGDVTATHRLWATKNGSNVSSPVYHDGHLYWMHDNLGIAYCANARTGELVYEQRVGRAGQVYASPVLVGDRIYYLARDGKMYVVAAKPEFEMIAVNESLDDRTVFNASPAVAGNRLLLRTNKWLYCLGQE